jgi:ornithine cyclodeaminase/alanine dehydrogenase-like protein (mu-crystallin family)
MALFFTEEEVTSLLSMNDTLLAVEDAFRQLGQGSAVNRPRARVHLPGTMLHVMPAGSAEWELLGLKTYIAKRSGARFLFLLYGTSGELLAVMEADRLGQMRTGAASGVATRFMARPEAATVGIFGTGWQARSQLQAVAAVRTLRRAVAYGRDDDRRRRFCKEMSELLDLDVRPATAPEQVPEDADILITATTAREAVLHGEWLHSGQHINAIGANFANKREVDGDVIRRSTLVVVDSKEQALLECGDLIAPVSAGELDWDDVHELGDVVSGKLSGRQHGEDITLFESQGIAIEDVAVARKVFELGRERGVGTPLPF